MKLQVIGGGAMVLVIGMGAYQSVGESSPAFAEYEQICKKGRAEGSLSFADKKACNCVKRRHDRFVKNNPGVRMHRIAFEEAYYNCFDPSPSGTTARGSSAAELDAWNLGNDASGFGESEGSDWGAN